MATNVPLRMPVSTSTSPAAAEPFPSRFFNIITAFKQAAALKTAIELDLFTVLAEGSQSCASLALRVQASERGIRMLCDFLTAEGLLKREENGRYSTTEETAMFLNRKSPAFMGSAAVFLGDPMLVRNFGELTACVRNGGCVQDHSTVSPDNPIWVEFAQSMAPMAGMLAETVANKLQIGTMQPCRVLDIAAGHGMFGIAIARHNPHAEIYACDWKNVLTVAREHAAKAGVSDRYHCIEGSAFEADFGGPYDMVMITNFMHHFSKEQNEGFLRRVHDALKPGGRAITVEFVPNEDRVSPQIPAEFSLMMLATTPEGEAYTFPEYKQMFENAGFGRSAIQDLTPLPQRMMTCTK